MFYSSPSAQNLSGERTRLRKCGTDINSSKKCKKINREIALKEITKKSRKIPKKFQMSRFLPKKPEMYRQIDRVERNYEKIQKNSQKITNVVISAKNARNVPAIK